MPRLSLIKILVIKVIEHFSSLKCNKKLVSNNFFNNYFYMLLRNEVYIFDFNNY